MRFRYLFTLSACLVAGASILVACSPSRSRVGSQSRLVANADKPYAACVQYCRKTSRYTDALVACERSCNDARKNFPHLDESYRSYEGCADDLDDLDLNRLDIIAEGQALCEQQYEHIHKRFGCKEGVAAFYNAATVANVCGGYTALNVLPDSGQTPPVSAPTFGDSRPLTPLLPSTQAPQASRTSIPGSAPLGATPAPAYLPAPASAGVSYSAPRPAASPVLRPALAPQPSTPRTLPRPAPKAVPAPTRAPASKTVPTLAPARKKPEAPVTVKGSPAASARATSVAAPKPVTAPQPAQAPAPKPAAPAMPPQAASVPSLPPVPVPLLIPIPVQPPLAAPPPSPTPAQTAGQAETRGTPPPATTPRPANPSPAPSAGKGQKEKAANATSRTRITPPLPSMLRQRENLSPTIPPSAE